MGGKIGLLRDHKVVPINRETEKRFSPKNVRPSINFILFCFCRSIPVAESVKTC